MQTLSLYIIPQSSNSYASPVFKNSSISAITYGDAQSIIPTIFIPFLSSHSFAIFAKFKLLAAVIFIGLLFFVLSYVFYSSVSVLFFSSTLVRVHRSA